MSQELRNTNKAVYGASTASINDTIFIYGGSYNVVPWDKEAMWSLTADLKLSQLKTDPFASPALMHSTLVNVKNDLYAFGGHEVEDKKRSIELIRYYRFNYDNMTWTPLQKQEEEKEVGPEERFSHTAVVTPDQERVYIYGGMNVSNGFSDLWEYKPGEDQWYKLFNVEPRCGHTASILSNGKMVILGGYDCSISEKENKQLYHFDKATIFDTYTKRWYDQPIDGSYRPLPRTYHTAVTTKQDYIIICGGQDEKVYPFQTYISGGMNDAHVAMTAVLNTKNWSWIIPNASPFQPFARSHAIATLVNDSKMVFGLGLNYHTVYDGFYVFDLDTYKWLPPEESIESSITKSIALSIGLSVVGGVLVFSALTLAWLRFKKSKTDCSESGKIEK